MNFLSQWFSMPVLWAANLSILLLLVPLAPRAWRDALNHTAAMTAAVVMLALWWSLRAQIGGGHIAGMSYHLMGLALATLMVGPAAALWLGSVLMILATLMFHGSAHIMVVGMNIWCSVVPPVALSWALLILCRRFLPAHVFIYIFINGFFAAALGIMLTGLCITLALDWSAAFSDEALWHSVLPVFILIAWGEAFLTGLLCAIFVTLIPNLLTTFDDSQYLKHQNQIW